jgi:hypothetical protein
MIYYMKVVDNSYLCTKAKKCIFSSESDFFGREAAEAQPRLENRRGQRHFLAEVHIKFFRRLHELQNKRHTYVIGKITNLFCVYLFQIDKFININSFFVVFFISLPTK